MEDTSSSAEQAKEKTSVLDEERNEAARKWLADYIRRVQATTQTPKQNG